MAFSKEIPFMPRIKNRQTPASPKIDKSGFSEGNSASNPASMPAAVTKHEHVTRTNTTGAPFPNSAKTQPRYPPCTLPKYKKNTVIAHSKAAERSVGIKNASHGKKRMSSAPEINPAPITVPTINNVVFNISIP